MRIIRCEDCENFKNDRCAVYNKEKESALKDCLHDVGFSKYHPVESEKDSE